METYLCRTEGFLAWSAWSCSLPVSFCHKVMLNCRFVYDTCLVHYSFLFQEVFIVMAEQSGWCFVVGKSAVCRWKVSSFSRGFCVPGARGSGGWRGAGRTWKNTDNADSDQSLSPAASCCRSRFVVAGKEEIWCFLIRRPGRVNNTREKREKDARMRERAAKAEPEARRDRRKQTADAECYRM